MAFPRVQRQVDLHRLRLDLCLLAHAELRHDVLLKQLVCLSRMAVEQLPLPKVVALS